MRADRLVAILLMLQSKGRVTAQQVAEELEISERTARRDLEALGMADLPVFAVPLVLAVFQLAGSAGADHRMRHQALPLDALGWTLVLAGPVALLARRRLGAGAHLQVLHLQGGRRLAAGDADLGLAGGCHRPNLTAGRR